MVGLAAACTGLVSVAHASGGTRPDGRRCAAVSGATPAEPATSIAIGDLRATDVSCNAAQRLARGVRSYTARHLGDGAPVLRPFYLTVYRRYRCTSGTVSGAGIGHFPVTCRNGQHVVTMRVSP